MTRSTAPPTAGPLLAALPMDEGWRTQREAASRNESAILAAASTLFAQRGVETVHVRDIAAYAGVGVGTIYRRFGDKAGVIAAIIGDRERDLQDALLSGPPPLGPGATPDERLAAFLSALAQLTEEHLDVIAASQSSAPGARLRIGAHHAWKQHMTVLLSELRSDLAASDIDWLAEALLAPLAADLYASQRREHGISASRLRHNLLALARRASVSHAAPSGGDIVSKAGESARTSSRRGTHLKDDR